MTQSADIGDKLRVNVTAANQTGSASATSNVVGPIKAVAPTITAAPVASGTAARGAVVSTTSGTWTDNPTAYTYQWQRNTTGTTWANIAGATAATYTLAAADENLKVRVNVTAKNSIGSGVAASNEVGPVAKSPASNSVVPAVSGTAARGSVLTAVPGTWAGIGNTYTYQWQRQSGSDYANITGATAASYTVALADENLKLRVKVTATNPDGAVVAFSAATDAVAKVPPSNSALPAPSGTAARTAVLTITPGTWAGPGNTYAYQWQRQSGSDWVNIAGATKATYTAATIDETLKLRVAVTAKNPDGSAVAYSAETAAIAKAMPSNTVVPAVTGTAARSGVLTATVGTWANTIGIVYTYQWQRQSGSDWNDIAAATKSTYTLTQADEATSVRIKVTGTNVDGNATAYSSASATVAAAPPVNTHAPAITGTPTRLSKLTLVLGTWTGAGNTYAYQWQRQTGSDWDDITGATAVTYALGDADTGHSIRIEITATNVDDHATAVSPATAAVGKLVPTMTGQPAITGTAHTGLVLTTTAGVWTPGGYTLAYQWQRGSGTTFADISGATANTYTLTDDDLGATVRVKVTATNSDGSTDGLSKATAVVLATPHASREPGGHGHADGRQPAVGLDRHLGVDREPRAHVQVRVVPLPGHRHDGDVDGLQVARRRQRHRDLHDRGGRRRHQARRPRDGDQLVRRRQHGAVGADRRGRRPRADQQHPAGDLGHGDGQVPADGDRRHVERPDSPRLPTSGAAATPTAPTAPTSSAPKRRPTRWLPPTRARRWSCTSASRLRAARPRRTATRRTPLPHWRCRRPTPPSPSPAPRRARRCSPPITRRGATTRRRSPTSGIAATRQATTARRSPTPRPRPTRWWPRTRATPCA